MNRWEIEGLCLSDVLETLTPSRKKVAYAAIELYKRLKEGQVESPALYPAIMFIK